MDDFDDKRIKKIRSGLSIDKGDSKGFFPYKILIHMI